MSAPDPTPTGRLGLSGHLTAATVRSPLTPLFLLAALLVGALALLAIPREEEPQISVPMVDVLVEANGLHATDAVELVTKPLEALVKAIDGVEHVYSQSRDDRVMVTARFLVGTNADAAIVRVHEKIRANLDRIPQGIGEPLIVGRGINDVPVLVVTLSADPAHPAAERWTEAALYQLADEVRSELVKVENVGLTFVAGGAAPEIRVEPDPEALARFGITLQQLQGKIAGANRSFLAGRLFDGGKTAQIAAGQTLGGIPDIGLLLLTSRDNRPVYVRDVARVLVGPPPVERISQRLTADAQGTWHSAPAVSLAIAKRAGANAVQVTQALRQKLSAAQGDLIPAGVVAAIARDYGETANDKANELLFHLGLATLSIVALVWLAIGWREALVTLIVIPTTILLTLFAAWMMGYTINRVSLFALIFSIGILVDDAIVVVENIARHWGMQDGRNRVQAAIEAVAEVGNPTIVATLTVIAALLPMLFVSGMMGPYMAPIPVNASAAMLFSFLVAMVLAPWLMLKLAGRHSPAQDHHDEGKLGRLYRRVAGPVLASKGRAWLLLAVVGAATFASMGLFYTKSVTVKLLPFDNKSELAVMVDLPEGASLENTAQSLQILAQLATSVPEVRAINLFAGTPAPFNFNGLVRHYFFREAPELGELALELAPKHDRQRASHEIALELRQRFAAVTLPAGTSVKVVEVPPGPPVMATLIAELYGPDAETRRELAAQVKQIFANVPYIVDIDDSIGAAQPRLRIAIDQERLEFFGVDQADVYDTLRALLGSVPVGYSHRGQGRDPMPIVIRLPKQDLAWGERLAATPVPANALPGNRGVVELGDVVRISREAGSPLIYRRDGRFTDMVTAELAGQYEAPIYGMMAVNQAIEAQDWGKLPRPEILLHGQPQDESRPSLLWDGEWEVTWVTFRDMGGAFMVALLGIYVLVVAQFGSFKLPLVILTPVPLTLIGILLGHWAFGAPFSATSMIGFIALAGIIVRNSILLVDFIRHSPAEGGLRAVLIQAGAVRFKPILLTALAAMIGAATILTDSIFQGLAISLLFGLASSTLLTVLVIPALYVVLRTPKQG